MRGLKGQIRATTAFGVASLVVLGLSHLALVDIYHGEPDLSTEWAVLRLSAVILLTFVVLSLFTLRRALQRFR